MPNDGAAGFWSYAHDDNKLDGGAILQLARLIKEEYNLLSGGPLDLFIDRDGIAWGEEWQERIDHSLAQTTFFIPIITPRYFTRPECRRELLEFTAKAKSLGVEELLLPILYIETDGLSPESEDEVVALIAKTQYVDWHAVRLVEPESREYRAAVNALARRMLDISKKVAEVQLNREISADPEEDVTDGISDLVESIMRTLPEWLDIVMREKIVDAQIQAVWKQTEKQLWKLQSSKAPASAILATRTRWATEFLPLAERAQKDAEMYLSMSMQLDPLVSALARLVAEHPETFPLVIPVRESIDEAMEEIERTRANEKDPSVVLVVNLFAELKHLGRIFQKGYAVMSKKEQFTDAGNGIVTRWDTELRRPE